MTAHTKGGFMQSNPVTQKHLLSKRAVLKQIPISGATLARRVAAGAFPRPVRIGKRRVAWVQSEISDWLAARMEERGSTRLSEPRAASEFNGEGE
jgi:prophage regulatory protein